MRWAQPGHKIAGIQSSQSRRNEAERGHTEPRQAGPRSSRVQSEGFMVRSLVSPEPEWPLSGRTTS